jgi:hypothetical protein
MALIIVVKKFQAMKSKQKIINDKDCKYEPQSIFK